MRQPLLRFLGVALAALSCGFAYPKGLDMPRLSPDEIALAISLKLPDQPRPPADPTNQYADNPRAASLGKSLFFDPRLSANGKIACASCHRPEHAFADPAQFSRGLSVTKRNSPTLVGSGWSRWFFADGRSDSQWAQALGPLLNPDEHGLTRTGLALRIRDYYRKDYEALFGPFPPLNISKFDRAGLEDNAAARKMWEEMPASQKDVINRILANTGKAIAAFERTLTPAITRFDRFAAALAAEQSGEARHHFNSDEIQGFRLFVGSARCIQCHNGPMFSNYQFHNVGLRQAEQDTPTGNRLGWPLARASDFSCLGRYSDKPSTCPSRFTGAIAEVIPGAHKTPTLRNLTLTAPYMHAGEFSTLDEVIEHYSEGGRSNNRPGTIGNELVRLNLTAREREQLKAFLLTLSPDPASRDES